MGLILSLFALLDIALCDEISFFLKPRKRFCFHEALSIGDEVSGAVIVNPAALYQVQFTVNTPGIKGPVYSSLTTSDSYAIVAAKSGTYHFCFEVLTKETPGAENETVHAASKKDLMAVCDFTLDVARAASPASVDRFTATLEQAHKVMSNVQADQRYSKYRENRFIDGLSSVSRRLWVFLVIEIVLIILASGMQMGIITSMHKRIR